MNADRNLSPISIDQLTAMLDNAPVAIYVSAVDSHELLYVNAMARERLTRPLEPGVTCYQAVGRDAPCSFCTPEKIGTDAPLVRQFQNPDNGRLYQLTGKRIDWAGRPAHIEYLLDITEAQKEQQQAKALQEELLSTFSSLPSGLCVYRFHENRLTPLYRNPAFFRLVGRDSGPVQTAEPTSHSDLNVHPQDVACLQETVREAVERGGVFHHTFRVLANRDQTYRWLRADCSVKTQKDGDRLLYCVFSDVSEQLRMEQELTAASEKMQDLINAIPGGVAIYRVSDILETVYFSDGVPSLSGYTVEEYQELVKGDAAEMTYWEDTDMVMAQIQRVLQTRQVAKFEFRKQHRDGHIVWVRVQVKWMGEDEGRPLLHCVFHNISDLKEAHLEMDHLVNSIPGGIASYRVEGERFIPTFFSDGVSILSGHTREEFEQLVQGDAMNTIYEADRPRVLAAAKAALESGDVLDISYRTRHKDGSLLWIHLNGRRMDPRGESMRFYAVFTGMSAETRLFQSMANEMADGIYVIEKDTFDLLYVNESKELFANGSNGVGQKCYSALHGKNAPCEFCTLQSHAPDGKEHEMHIPIAGRFYTTRFRESDWNGIPAYVKYVQDVTDEVRTHQEKARLEQYFQTLVKNLPGGVAVVRCRQDGVLIPEFLSDGFAELTDMTMDEAWALYRANALTGVHPEDRDRISQEMADFIASGEIQCQLVYRLRQGSGRYVWVKNTLSLIQSEGGEHRVYAVYHDMTQERAEQARLRQQFNDIILQHYRTPGPNALILGHCNVTQNRILEIIDHTDSDLIATFGSQREAFFTGIGGLVVEEEQRRAFLDTYLNEPTLDAFRRGETEMLQTCFIQLPQESRGRYVQFKVNLVAAPDSGDITGILTVTDVTEQTLSDRMLHQLSVARYDLVSDVDLFEDRFTILTGSNAPEDFPGRQGRHSQRISHILENLVLPKDRDRTAGMLDPSYMLQRLRRDGSYSFSFSIMGGAGDVRTKSLVVSATDLRLGRVCLARTDITDSVREQQGLLNAIAYTFEMMAFIRIPAGSLTLYTRRTVLENLPPIVGDYAGAESLLAGAGHSGEAEEPLRLDTILQRLEQAPEGYDFVLPYQTEGGLRYKQINVLWGGQDHKTVCIVQGDVTDVLTAERRQKESLEKALALAETANQAKSDFLSSMSHDIRTPMNAIMGMTALAAAHLDNRDRVEDCLQKISLSSRHLLSLINDILDMSKIERSKITLNRTRIDLPDLVEQLSAMIEPQAQAAGLAFKIQTAGILHHAFYGDTLRINQIFVNLLGNAVKFTPPGGSILFTAEELPSQEPLVRYRFTIADTGVGMSQEFLSHIFEPFTRNPSAARIEGSGLGLSITKGLVDLMGGQITVESTPGLGSVFQVELSCEAAQGEAPASAGRTSAAPSVTGRRFLVAEDNAINSEILCELLKMHGAETTVRTNGLQTVEAFRDAPPGTYDAILMDIQMPEMNGYEATRAIRRLDRPDAGAIPIVAMTANAFSEDIQAALEAGMTAHVAKPIDVQTLWMTLSKVLEGEGPA